ncbi:MAG: thymidine phosphorylase [candidate division KSB1 bacterium]|nr:thymidine phosphorylase [candidate division KSB1 bacterium]MDZ7335890.1 thymidine phosphorylase [candidate division KSB1 bacterium]MDZ7356686.1 thymidine phosphorylase [candidate division KSB1 bacterium]MDZ7398563.1 thymidine phosphorylase [candidate division KSB1 bacterium]
MNIEQLIVKKRDGSHLSEAELKSIIDGYVAGLVPDYQMAALLMAIYFQGMSIEETQALTKLMVQSGRTVDFSHLDRMPVDKHSTGGVGDKVSLVLAPLAAAAGVAVPMMSGRGLGHSGGTLDKLESIPGFRTQLSLTEFVQQVEKIGLAMIGQTDEIVPADKKIYALRDRTGTVPSIPLVVASILSKKIAEGAKALVLDVKTGRGAFFSSFDRANQLAETFISIAKSFGLPTTAMMTAMDQPLGYAVGNWLEVKEAIDTLHGGGPNDLVEITLALTAEMLRLAGKPIHHSDQLQFLLANGAAYNKFIEMVTAQGGDISVVENPARYPFSQYHETVLSTKSGYVHEINALKIGLLSMELGAGRAKIGDPIDPTAGIVLCHKVGDRVERGEPLAEIYHSKVMNAEQIEHALRSAIEIDEAPCQVPRLILGSIH